MPVHVHRLISSDGVTEITGTDEDYTRQWLQRQRLTDEPVVVAYAGYLPISRATAQVDTGSVTYCGFIHGDTSDCPACQGSQ